jgi:hypothetical protein
MVRGSEIWDLHSREHEGASGRGKQKTDEKISTVALSEWRLIFSWESSSAIKQEGLGLTVLSLPALLDIYSMV